MKKNISQHNVHIITLCLFLTIALVTTIQYVSANGHIESGVMGASFDTKLGQLSDASKSMAKSINPFAKKQSSVFAGKTGSANCGLTLNFRQDKEFTYTLVVKNEGKQACDNVSATVYYSNNESFVSSNPKASASNYYWQLGKMSPGDMKTVFIVTDYKESSDPSTSETEACATADNGEDACATLNLSINPTSISSATNNTARTRMSDRSDTSTSSSFNPAGKEYGTWIWTSPYAMSSTYKNKVISGAVSNNINAIYVTIDDYLTLKSDTEREKHSNALSDFIALANKNNIQVDVVAGWRDWAEDPNVGKSNSIIDYAITYNNSHKNKIRSVQFDVEPYLLPNYEKNKGPILRNFVKFVKKSSKRLGSNPLRLSIVIPHFYDSGQKWTPVVEDGYIYNYTFNHILRILDKRPGSTVILMSYRNKAEGEDGSIQISKVEIDQTSAAPHPTKIIVGQEVGNVEPDYVTFYQTSKSYYVSQLNLITKQFKDKKGFGGTAVHYIDPLLDL